MLPGLLIAAPLVGRSLETLLPAILRVALSLLLLLDALPFTFLKGNHPVVAVSHFPPPIWRISRRATMFESMPEQEAKYDAIAKYLRSCGCSQVGVVPAESAVGLAPLFRSMREQGFTSFRLEYVLLDTPFQHRNYPLGPFTPDAIAFMGPGAPSKVTVSGIQFLPAFTIQDFSVYRRSE
jgi:hypothetical protein